MGHDTILLVELYHFQPNIKLQYFTINLVLLDHDATLLEEQYLYMLILKQQFPYYYFRNLDYDEIQDLVFFLILLIS